MIDFSEKHVQAEMIMYNKTMDQVKAVLWSKFVHYDLKALRSGIHTPELMGLLEQLHEPLEEQRLEVRAKKLAGVQMSPAIN